MYWSAPRILECSLVVRAVSPVCWTRRFERVEAKSDQGLGVGTVGTKDSLGDAGIEIQS